MDHAAIIPTLKINGFQRMFSPTLERGTSMYAKRDPKRDSGPNVCTHQFWFGSNGEVTYLHSHGAFQKQDIHTAEQLGEVLDWIETVL